MIPVTTAATLEEHLLHLGVTSGDHLTVHSRLISFGVLDGGLEMVLDVLRRVVGPTGTIFVPTYSAERGTIYDRRSTPAVGVGALAEYVRQQPGAVRSRCPIFSHAGIGAHARLLETLDGRAALGRGSDFELFHDSDCKLLLLGATFGEAAAFGHHIEALAEVPYREWLDLNRAVIDDDGVVTQVKCRYYGHRDFDMPTRQYADNFDVLEEPLKNRAAVSVVAAPIDASRLCALVDVARVGLDILARDPYGMVRAE